MITLRIILLKKLKVIMDLVDCFIYYLLKGRAIFTSELSVDGSVKQGWIQGFFREGCTPQK